MSQYSCDLCPQICSNPYRVWGVSVPQTSVPPAMLREAAERVGAACRSRGVIGHFSVDFVTFIHPETVRSCTSIKSGYHKYITSTDRQTR